MNPNDQDEHNMSSLTSKEWLNLSWNYFQLHAQQRISYFNFFVVFSTILTTGLITTYQTDFKVPFLGIFIGLLESFVSYIFLKIDLRNKLLTGNAETVIKKIEIDFNAIGKESYSLFNNEENQTQQLKAANNSKFYLSRHLTHGDSYKIIYGVFFVIGILMSVTSVVVTFGAKKAPKEDKPTVIYYNIKKVQSSQENHVDSLRCKK